MVYFKYFPLFSWFVEEVLSYNMWLCFMDIYIYIYIYIYHICSRNSRTFLNKILYLNLGCVIYARKLFYANKSGYTGNFLNIVLKAWITRVNMIYIYLQIYFNIQEWNFCLGLILAGVDSEPHAQDVGKKSVSICPPFPCMLQVYSIFLLSLQV